jgi:ABC-2 type transport system ATP-binding protein
VAPGVLTGLLGPNGAGETTVIRVMLGVLTPHRDEVRRDGDPVDQNVRRRLGVYASGTGSLSRDAGW